MACTGLVNLVPTKLTTLLVRNEGLGLQSVPGRLVSPNLVMEAVSNRVRYRVLLLPRNLQSLFPAWLPIQRNQNALLVCSNYSAAYLPIHPRNPGLTCMWLSVLHGIVKKACDIQR